MEDKEIITFGYQREGTKITKITMEGTKITMEEGTVNGDCFEMFEMFIRFLMAISYGEETIIKTMKELSEE